MRGPLSGAIATSFLLCLLGPVLAAEYSATDTPLAITDYTNTRSSLVVTDAGTITDLNVRVNITHTYVSDLHIRLTGPGGQECFLALSADSDGDNFDNTIFDDEAADSIQTGTAPFSGSFYPYASLGVFDSTSINGTWYLDVSDQYGGDEGTLNSWCLIAEVSGGGGSGEYCSSDTPLPIVDYQNTRSTIVITDDFNIADLNVKVNITHTYDSDLHIRVTGPGGQEAYLAYQNGSGGDNFTDTIFDDEADTPIASGTAPFSGPFRPRDPLSVYDGTSALGTWYLDVYDSAGGDTGSLNGWCLIFTSGPSDTTAPVITMGSVNPTRLWPPNGKSKTVAMCGNICDADSGLDKAWCEVEDEYGECEGSYDLTCDEAGNFYHELSLVASRHEDDMDGRLYTVTICAVDCAGNEAETSFEVLVPHDQGTRNSRGPG